MNISSKYQNHRDLNINLIWRIKGLKNLVLTINLDSVSDFQMPNCYVIKNIKTHTIPNSRQYLMFYLISYKIFGINFPLYPYIQRTIVKPFKRQEIERCFNHAEGKWLRAKFLKHMAACGSPDSINPFKIHCAWRLCQRPHLSTTLTYYLFKSLVTIILISCNIIEQIWKAKHFLRAHPSYKYN